MQFNICHRTFLTPHRLHKMNRNVSAMCQRCKVKEGKLLHMLWTCPYLANLWKLVIATVLDIIETEIPKDPKILCH